MMYVVLPVAVKVPVDSTQVVLSVNVSTVVIAVVELLVVPK
jgi:hypothetical protein